MSMPEIKDVKKAIIAINKLGVISKINIRQDDEDLYRDFASAIMQMGDLDLDDQITDEMMDIYNQIVTEKVGEGATEEDTDFDREAEEDQLRNKDFEEVLEYIEEKDIDYFIESEDHFWNEMDSIIEEILDLVEEKSNESSEEKEDDDDSDRNVLSKMSYSDLRKHLTNNKIDIVVKAKDWRDEKEKQNIISKILSFGQAEGPNSDDEGLRAKLFEASYSDIRKYIASNNIDIVVKAKDWRDTAKRASIVLDIVGDTKASAEDKSLKLEDMNFEEINAFVKANGLEDDLYEVSEEDWADKEEKEAFLEELKGLIKDKPVQASKTPKVKKPKTAEQKAAMKERGKALGGAKRKEGKTIQEIIGRIIGEAKGPISQEEVVDLAIKERIQNGDGATEKSVNNFFGVLTRGCRAMGVLEKTPDGKYKVVK